MYSPVKVLSAPNYRFQAIEDGDIVSLQGNYSEAIGLYQDAIESKTLDWWSRKRFEHSREAAINFTTPAVLVPDLTEYPRLAAYVYYRIMLLQLVQTDESDASTTYNILQQKFGNDPMASLTLKWQLPFGMPISLRTKCTTAVQRQLNTRRNILRS